MEVTVFHWIIFNAGIVALLVLDLCYFYYRPHAISIKEACITSLAWIALALLFNYWIFLEYGKEPALQFLSGYLLEKALSVDNLFIFLLIFSHFQVPEHAKHTVLFYGILGAIVMRAVLIFAGIGLISVFHWIHEAFGLFLIIIGLKLLFSKEQKVEVEKNHLYRLVTYWVPVTSGYHGTRFFMRGEKGQWMATPLFLVVVLIESIDLLFALDSVPAILGITTVPFLVYTSNIFAILGLRSLFFVLEKFVQMFYLLHYAVSLILVLIGIKMVARTFFEIPVEVTLIAIVSILILALIGSWFFPQKSK